jgi:hypothetical protein
MSSQQLWQMTISSKFRIPNKFSEKRKSDCRLESKRSGKANAKPKAAQEEAWCEQEQKSTGNEGQRSIGQAGQQTDGDRQTAGADL